MSPLKVRLELLGRSPFGFRERWLFFFKSLLENKNAHSYNIVQLSEASFVSIELASVHISKGHWAPSPALTLYKGHIVCLPFMEQVGRQLSLARVWHGSVACLLDQPEPGQDKPSIGSKEVTEGMYN